LATLTEQSQRLHRLVGDLSAVSRAEERQLNLHPDRRPRRHHNSLDLIRSRQSRQTVPGPPWDAKLPQTTIATAGRWPLKAERRTQLMPARR